VPGVRGAPPVVAARIARALVLQPPTLRAQAASP
jgi:hypothetical protein